MAITLSKLNTRERYAVSIAGVIICLFIFIQFIIVPITFKRASLRKKIHAKTINFEKMIALKTEYDTIKQKSRSFEARFRKRQKGFTLFSFLDKLAGDAGVKDNIASMKPSESDKISRVEVELQTVTMQQLTKYLHMVETSKKMAFVKRLSITKKGKQEGTINAILQVETVKAN